MPGIGKTTSIHCLAHQLLGDAYKEGVLELNASDERFETQNACRLLLLLIPGIEVLMLSETRSKHLLRRRSLFHPAGTRSLFSMKRIGRYHVQSFWDNFLTVVPAHSMTAGAQQALRRTMEIYSNTTRFCLACNMANKIIEPIQSRCAILRYAKLRDTEILKRLLEICEAEKVSSSDGSPDFRLIVW